MHSVHARFRRHISDAKKGKIDTHFTRAINKYGEENFVYETIDTASTREELTEKEKYWIDYYNSCDAGYNTSPGGYPCGGNTYYRVENLDEIKKKLSLSKLGGKNPHSRGVLMTDIKEDVQIYFSSMQEAADYLKIASHMPVSRRCRGVIVSPLSGRYIFEYCDDEGVTTIENTA